MMSISQAWGWQPPQTAFPIHITHRQSVWAYWSAVHWNTVAALHSYTHPTCLRFWGSGSLAESKWCHYVKVEADSHLKLLPPSILDIYIIFFTLKTCCSSSHSSSLTQFYPPFLAQILGFYFYVSCGVKMMSLRHGWGWQPPQTASNIHIRVVELALCPGTVALIALVLSPLLPNLLSSQFKRRTSFLRARRQVASASVLLPMQVASQWKRKRRTSFRGHINPQHQAHQ